tara:strand:- start:165 stop:497 length:333 start_codon:yes stop_codon:yes gene_type:complete
MTTTPTTTKPKRRRARRARKPATVAMNEQLKAEIPATLRVELPMPPVERVERTKPDVQLISRDAYYKDFLARKQLHDYEVAELIDDLKIGYDWAKRTAKKLYAKVLEVAP